MNKKINSVAVLGSGTMGTGIAALAADKNCKVLLLDINEDAINKSKAIITNEKKPILSLPGNINNITFDTFDNSFDKISNYDWICEAVVEKLDIKREIFMKINNFMKEDCIVSSNTSGIPLKDITKDMPDTLCKNVCITHFFNPVKVMKLCELIPGEKTSQEVLNTLSAFLKNNLEKGVVYGKDTVNFIGNRIGCYFMLKGLHEGKLARKNNLSIEKIDAILSKPVGLPPTGLYGLIDLIGLDVMHSVGKNLEVNLPESDKGKAFVNLPEAELKLYNKGQLGRKTGGGFYRIRKNNDGEKIKEVFNLESESWETSKKEKADINGFNLILEESLEGKYIWNVMGHSLLYAAGLIPEIADDIVNIDNAMKWGFAWQKGPFEILDSIGPNKVIEKCYKLNIKLPKMLEVIKDSSHNTFYSANQEFLNLNGDYEKIQL